MIHFKLANISNPTTYRPENALARFCFAKRDTAVMIARYKIKI